MEFLEKLDNFENLDSFCNKVIEHYYDLLDKPLNCPARFDNNLKWINVLKNSDIRLVLTTVFIANNSNDHDRLPQNPYSAKHVVDVPKKLLLSAISSLQLYVIDNFIMHIEKLETNRNFEDCLMFVEDFFNLEEKDLQIPRSDYSLKIDGENICPIAKNPQFLQFSRLIFEHLSKNYQQSFQDNTLEHFHLILWSMRSAIVHQISLTASTGTLHKEISDYVGQIKSFLISQDKRINPSFKMNIMIEISNIYMVFGDQENSKKYLTLSKEYSNITFELVGKMGVRTQFQTKPVSQLVVDFKRSGECETKDLVNTTKTTINLPQDVKCDDETLLPDIKFVADDPKTPQQPNIKLKHLEQALMLTSVKFSQKFGSTSDHLLKEELLAYVYFLLKHCDIWIIQFNLLEMRSLLEMTNGKRVERSLKQLQTLTDAILNPRGSLNEQANQRIRYFYSVFSSPFWRIQKHLADLLYSLGVYKSALDIYLSLKQWDRVIDCYRKIGMASKAEELIREQLSKNDNQPELHCMLGEITGNLDCFHHAWEISNQRFALAPKMLGLHYYKIQDYDQALEYFWKSVQINSLQPDVWYRMGYIGLLQQDWDLAVMAYRKVLQFDQDSFEAWNNLSKAYIKIGDNERAMKTLKEAIKCNFDQWMIWENYIAVCASLGEVHEIILAWHRLIDLKGHYIDDQVAQILVLCVQDEPTRLITKALELFDRMTITSPGSAITWQLYAQLLMLANREDRDLEKIEQCLLKSQRQILHTGWEKEFKSIFKVLKLIQSLTKDVLEFIEKKSPQNSKQILQSFQLTMNSILVQVDQIKTNLSIADHEKLELQTELQSLQHLKDIVEEKLNQ